MRLITPTNRYRKAPVVSACYPPLRTVLSILLGPHTSVHNRERPLFVYASVMLLLTTQLF